MKNVEIFFKKSRNLSNSLDYCSHTDVPKYIYEKRPKVNGYLMCSLLL